MPRSIDFEKPIEEIHEKISDLKRLTRDNEIDFSDEIKIMEKRASALQTKIYNNLNAVQTLKIARHPDRPGVLDYISLAFQDFIELHGDRAFGDDHSIVGGIAFLDKHPVMIIGQ
ncbi:acetyl-CoA carboxylase carboxyl transferase subunit alpha, partial [Candidatus Margulisiibacteriota bacterium]